MLGHESAPASPAATSTVRKRPYSSEELAFGTASHEDQCNPTADLASAACAARLPSPSELGEAPGENDPNATPKAPQLLGHSNRQQGRSPTKKLRAASSTRTTEASVPLQDKNQSQTATPPSSAGCRRKLAPKPKMDSGRKKGFPQPQLNTSFMATNADDVFGYPGGPATAPPVTGPRPFWGLDMDPAGIDSGGMAVGVNFVGADTGFFDVSPMKDQTGGAMGSLGWETSEPMFQQEELSVEKVQQSQRNQQQAPRQSRQSKGSNAQRNATPRRERPLAPKKATSVSTPSVSQASPSQSLFAPFQAGNNTTFGGSPGGVDPGLLFSQQMNAVAFEPGVMLMPGTTMGMDMSVSMPMDATPQPMTSMNTDVDGQEVLMPASNNAPSGSQGSGRARQRKKLEKAPAISPTKRAGARPNVSRSFSESSRSVKRVGTGGRGALPVLAPAKSFTGLLPSMPPMMNHQGNSKLAAQGLGVRQRRTSSPVKTPHHKRISSLLSIPEFAADLQSRSPSARRASVKFVIDENGRARAETTLDNVDDNDNNEVYGTYLDNGLDLDPYVTSHRKEDRLAAGSLFAFRPPASDSDGDCSSSSDDEEIIIPSRNTSFTFPCPPRTSSSSSSRPPTATNFFALDRLHQRSFSERYAAYSFQGVDGEDDMDLEGPSSSSQQSQRPSTGSSLGDAAAELRKVMQAGTSRLMNGGQQLPSALGGRSGGGRSGGGLGSRSTPGQRSSSSTISESSLRDSSPTPAGKAQSRVRCVCNKREAATGAFLVKW